MIIILSIPRGCKGIQIKISRDIIDIDDDIQLLCSLAKSNRVYQSVVQFIPGSDVDSFDYLSVGSFEHPFFYEPYSISD